MLLLTGPAGSGKTWHVLTRFREALRRGDTRIRLLVPTATLAQHVQNQLAREGYVFPPELVQTLSRFTDDFAADLPQVSEAAFYLIVEEAARRVNRAEFARVIGLPGFCASLARTMEEFSSAGCSAERLAQHLPEAPLAAAFLAVYQEAERELRRRGVALRAERLARAAEKIEREGMPGVATVWLDGFHALPDPELAVIAAMGRRAEITLTLPAAEPRVLAAGFTERRLPPRRLHAPVEVVEAAAPEREAEEIARRILEQAEGGRAFRDMAVIVRAQEFYEPLLRATFERFGIPARFYFESRLAEHPLARCLAGVVDALLGGWDWEATLAALRLAPGAAGTGAMDRFDFAVRERMPGRGLQGLAALAREDDYPLRRLLDALRGFEDWRALSLPGREWAQRLRGLRALARPRRPADGLPRGAVDALRGSAAALEAFETALDDAAAAAGEAAVPLSEFWCAAKSVLRLTMLRVADLRRDVVHVLGAHEARQWQVRAAFVCGLVEKQFPRMHRQDPFFPDAARRQLAAAGIRVRTAAEFEREERLLFDAAVTRASDLTVLSYPRIDAGGQAALRSLFLDEFPQRAPAPPAVRPEPLAERPSWRPEAALRDAASLAAVAARTATFGPTSLEVFLACPFRYFGDHLLALRKPPARPEKRFDASVQGGIVHAVLAEWYAARQPIEPLFERVFEEFRRRANIPEGYRTEWMRRGLLEDLRAFAGQEGPPGGETRTEQEFSYELGEGVTVRGRIDRLDVSGGRAAIVDYKYSGAKRTRERVENPNLLQPALYILAVERFFRLEPAGMHYVGLRGEVAKAGWDAPFDPAWLAGAAERALDAAARIRAGEIAPAPADGETCGWCESHDVCRYRAAGAGRAAEEA